MESASSESINAALLAFLRTPESYPWKPAQVRSTETHISWVFFPSPFVYKIKKPINLQFADFSTLAKRRYFCERELELNRRLSDDVYLEVVPIYVTDEGFSFSEGAGQIVEYAVKMRELPRGWFLHELLAEGAVGEKEIGRLIARLCRFYHSQIPTTEIASWGHPEKLRISTDENFEQVRTFIGQTISEPALAAIRAFTNGFLDHQEQLFQQRIEQRWIRDCHGDLRLEHVHLTPETVTIFDCIEFNDRFRFIDVANDLAFLAMDFDFESHPELGGLFLRQASQGLHDPGLLKVVTFYKSYRAFVRGKVESIQAAVDKEEASGHLARARRYFRLALRYSVFGSKPVLLVVLGPVASGKTTVARALAAELGWPLFSSDVIRKGLAGVPLTERLPPAMRTKLYAPEMSDRTYAELLRQGLAALGNADGVVLDATFSDPARRDWLREVCNQARIGLQMVELSAPHEEIVERLRKRSRNADEVSDARLEDLKQLNAVYHPPGPDESDVLPVKTSGPVATTLEVILLRLARQHALETDKDISMSSLG